MYEICLFYTILSHKNYSYDILICFVNIRQRNTKLKVLFSKPLSISINLKPSTKHKIFSNFDRSGKSFTFDVFSQCNVSLGKHYYRNWPIDPVVVKTGISSFFIHDQYDYTRPQLGYDIALLKLDKPVSLNDNIRPICLSFELQELRSDSICYTTGWGIDDFRK